MWGPFVALLINGGLRVSEATSLTRGANGVDLEASPPRVTVRPTETKTDAGVHTIGLDATTASALQRHRVATAYELTNVRFEVRDIADLPADTDFDVVTAFDAIHDQVAPRRVLAAVRRCIRPGGAFVMVDMDASSNLEDNIGNQMAAFFYSVSLMHCLQVSLAGDGEGLGTAWGRQKAVELLDEAGFGDVQVIDTPPEDPVNVIYVARP